MVQYRRWDGGKRLDARMKGGTEMAKVSAVKRYNELMNDLCREHSTIGTSFSENTDGWNLRDMVSEVQYVLDLYDDPSTIYWEDAHDDNQPSYKPWYKEWLSEKRRMKRFIERYK